MRAAVGTAGPKLLITAVLSACFLVDPIIGPFTWLQFRKAAVKKEVDRHLVVGIEEADLVVLRFTKDESETLLRWEHSAEFEYDRQMYDVVETWTLGDDVYFRCWWDREETKLNNRLRELASRALGTALKMGERCDPWSSSFKSSSFTPAERWNVLSPEPAAFWIRANFRSYRPVAIRPPTPPPRPA